MMSLLDSALFYDFRDESTAVTLTGFGWPEPQGRWSVGDYAEIEFPSPDTQTFAVIFEYCAHTLPDLLPAQRVGIFINGTHIEDWTLRDRGHRKRAIIIDRQRFGNASKTCIRMQFLDCASPKSIGISSDERNLAIFVGGIYILDLHGESKRESALMQIGRRYVGTESRKTWDDKMLSGFWSKFMSGKNVLDIGFSSYGEEFVVPICEDAIGVDIDYPGYDGRTLPFPDNSQDTVYSSHCLEHIPDAINALQDWFRVVRQGGHIIIAVPNMYLYERRRRPPSQWNSEHLRMYSPTSFLSEIESALEANSYRVRFLEENDLEYEYDLSPDEHPRGNYEIVVVIQKITKPSWNIKD